MLQTPQNLDHQLGAGLRANRIQRSAISNRKERFTQPESRVLPATEDLGGARKYPSNAIYPRGFIGAEPLARLLGGATVQCGRTQAKQRRNISNSRSNLFLENSNHFR